ncbi:LodA/GoxA family CTQ-dependent oxidase [Leptolyngbya cf. ectocarpi LEGE 11479]|uniref:LodA/GoxA family CTQ-dependent oxidase n=1 Tax=Leptolyngbya cf. ectocarpi LEGE 11479 TaxID=1828722 RepID=A0A928ZYA8_LEPEC|nr:LodA/GoxA family CTQ-dependent oxidase [Leptolyngbya ectocarpi]MBE9069737.1 LodA/GoxA family CTQ-dependent oxidase [Leptolyngbya cf. ectocarpi LEGE 11479]
MTTDATTFSVFEIHPKIGVARLGNSPEEFYLGPETTGGLPTTWDSATQSATTTAVSQYKDDVGRIKRQAACFKIYAYASSEADNPTEIKVGSLISDNTVTDIQWTVHIASKKASWYTFSELQGDLMFGGTYDADSQAYKFDYDPSTNLNSYQNNNVPVNNPKTKSDERYQLLIDPGPRTVHASTNLGFDQGVDFSKYNIPGNPSSPNYSSSAAPFGQTSSPDYIKYDQSTSGNFPVPETSTEITNLGRIFTDSDGRLIALGGHGAVQNGKDPITTFRGAAGYYDDIADGYVIATLKLSDNTYIDLEPAWLIIGSPKVAPELVNIITMDDILFDVAVRHQQFFPDLYNPSGGYDNTFQIPSTSTTSLPPELVPIADSLNSTLPIIFRNFNPNFQPNYERDILPIIQRPQSYRWVANVPSMIEFANPGFDTSHVPQSTDSNYAQEMANLLEYFLWFRVPVPPEYYDQLIGQVAANDNRLPNGPNQLFYTNNGDSNVPQLPLMPLNSGDNSIVNDGPIYKFQALTLTQYFFLYQWAMGKFTSTCSSPTYNTPTSHVESIDHGVVGNCVGAPNAPGIEVCWTIRNPYLYQAPYQIAVDYYDYDAYSSTPYTNTADSVNQKFVTNYNTNGLAYTLPPRDECVPTKGKNGKLIPAGCQPGDLTKRMAIPWQADFFDCTVQTPSLLDPMYNQDDNSGMEAPPTYYVYWWPPQSPYNTFIGPSDGNQQVLESFITRNATPAGASFVTGAGQQALYHRGISSFNDTTTQWSALGFIVNQGTENYPYYVEVERNVNQIAQSLLKQEKVSSSTSK